MSAEATCRCICHAFGDERLYCEHRGCCNAWAKGYRDASEDSRAIAGICMTCGVTVSHRPGKPGEYDHTCPSRSRAPSPPETPASEGDECERCGGTGRDYCPTCKGTGSRKVLGYPASPASPASDADRCDCDGQKGQGCTICASSETPASEGTMGDRDRLRDGIEAAARVLAANGIDARSHLDLRPDARREITEILASASPASAPTDPATKEQS